MPEYFNLKSPQTHPRRKSVGTIVLRDREQSLQDGILPVYKCLSVVSSGLIPPFKPVIMRA